MQKPQAPATIPAEILTEATRQHRILSQGVAAIYPSTGTHGPDGLFDKLVEALLAKRPLKVKLGMDPTAPDLHLGHSIPLAAMRKFQELGHIAQPLIGDYTARIGDPAGRNKTRPPLNDAEIDANAQTYYTQLFKIIKNEPAVLELLYNGQWLKNLTFADTIKLCAQTTVAQIISREDFANRLANHTPISMHELLYPIMQGYDSVAMHCDIEFGGTDQTFNCLMGRQLMEARGMAPQIVMTFPLLEGLDGTDKMSKSKGNYIGITEDPTNMFGKTMSISDALMHRWYDLLTDISAEQRAPHPMAAKKDLAELITARFHGATAAAAARAAFEERFSKRNTGLNAENFTLTPEILSGPLFMLVFQAGAAESKSKARQLIEQGALKLNGQTHQDPTQTTQTALAQAVHNAEPVLMQVGKLFVRQLKI